MQLLDVLYDVGHWSLDSLWLPLLIWTIVALPLLMFVRFVETIPLHVRYRTSLATLFSLPLGLLAAQIPFVELATVREITAVVTLPAVEATAVYEGAARFSWTTYHTAGAAVMVGLLMAGWRLGALLMALGYLQRFRRRVDAHAPLWLASIGEELRQELGIKRSVRVELSKTVASPLTFGYRHPLIFLPDSLVTSPEDLRLALLHEFIHVRRRDYLMQWTEHVIGALFFVHPLVALLRQDISVLREITCDADVLAYTDNRPRYARLLYQYSSPPAPSLDMAVGIVVREHHLTKRIKSMKDLFDFNNMNRSKRTGVFVSAGLLIVIMGVVACSDLLVHPTSQSDQTSSTSKEHAAADTYTVVEEMPELIGGLSAIQENLSYPELARKAGIEGRVIVQFVVDETGTVVGPRIVRGLGSGLDAAALAAVESAQFKPGKQRGEPVKVRMSLPITFSLGGSDGASNAPQASKSSIDKDGRYTVVDEMPTLVGGLAAVSEHLRYPQQAKDAGVEGRVIVQFVVDENGRVTEPEIVRGIGYGLDEAAVEAVEAVTFTPGKQDGKPVKVKMALPISFKL